MARPLLFKLLNLAGLTDTKYEHRYARVRTNAANTIVAAVRQLCLKRSTLFFSFPLFSLLFCPIACHSQGAGVTFISPRHEATTMHCAILARVFLRRRSFEIARDIPNAVCIVRDRAIARVTRLRTTVSTGFRR